MTSLRSSWSDLADSRSALETKRARQLCRGASLIACRLMAAAVDHPREADAEHLAMLGAAVRTRADGLGFRVEGYLAFHARHVSGIAILAGPCLSFFPAASANHMRFSIL